MSNLKAGVVGFGNIGSLHAQAYEQHPLVNLVAIVEPDQEKVKQANTIIGCQVYDSVKQLLKEVKLDIVSICTPEASHFEIAEEFVENEVAILMEKPLTPTVEKADQLIQMVEDTKAFMSVNYILRFDQRIQYAKTLIENGVIGEPTTMFARRRGSVLGAEFYGKWTDLIISTAIHDIDLMLYFNEVNPIRVYGEKVQKNNGPFGTDDGYMFMIKFEDGTIGTIETSWVLPDTVPTPLDAIFDLAGTKGGFSIEGSNQGMSVISKEKFYKPDLIHWPVVDDRLEGNLRRSIDTFVEAVINGFEPPMSIQEARKSLDLVEKIHESIKIQQPIYIDWEE